MKNIYLTKEVAEMLRVTERHVRELIKRGDLPAYQESRRSGYRITSDDVDDYVAKKKKQFESQRKMKK